MRYVYTVTVALATALISSCGQPTVQETQANFCQGLAGMGTALKELTTIGPNSTVGDLKGAQKDIQHGHERGQRRGGHHENILSPALLSRGLSISPTVVFVSFAFWTWLLGGPGAFLAMPLTFFVILILDSFPESRWLKGVLMVQEAPEQPEEMAP